MNPNHQRRQVEEVSSIFSVRRTVWCKKYGLISNQVQKSLPFGVPLFLFEWRRYVPRSLSLL